MDFTVFARPDVLEQYRAATAEAADDLRWRAGTLDTAVGDYLRATELAYEAPCRSAAAAVAAFADAVRGLGSWVGRVGVAFLDGLLVDGRRFVDLDRLAVDVPSLLWLAPIPGAGALVAADAVATGAHPRDLRAVAAVFGSASTLGSRVVDATDGTIGRAISRYLDWGAAVSRGATESEARWRSEAHLDLPARIGRAAFDGVVAAGGAYSGSAAGIAFGNYACAPLGPPVQAVCAAAGARAGTSVGGAVAELITDVVLGPEPSTALSRPLLASPEVEAARLDVVAGEVADAADAHADFVLERPWLWDDEFSDAPSVPPPAAPPQVPARPAGPR